MPPASIKSIISLIKLSIATSPQLEIALEGNPSSLSEQTLESFKESGITRLSIGIQSFRTNHLSFLGRDHSGTKAWKTLNHAYKVFDNHDPTKRTTVSCDLMFGIPNQSVQEWKEDLTAVIESIPDDALTHMSLYQLTYEPGTPLWKSAKLAGFNVSGTCDATAEMYETAVELVHTKTRLHHYEVSNYARPGHESIHNLAYWRGWDYMGVGPGAHGRLSDALTGSRFRTASFTNLKTYISQCNEIGGSSGRQVVNWMSEWDMMRELIVLGLRIKEGLSFKNANQLAFGRDIKQLIDWGAVEQCCDFGFLDYDAFGDVLAPTEKGLMGH
ncbi:hypothetical protein BDR26DRAFT_868196 [Obelidium mucronatum]|nr:hypothetical protein BDR26DRAFT_868196 [Obelidium mucronatum]